MKTYIIDWGEDANGGRYALLQARNIDEAILHADEIGGPFKLAELKIPKDDEGIRYLELSAPSETYCGQSFDCFKWSDVGDLI